VSFKKRLYDSSCRGAAEGKGNRNSAAAVAKSNGFSEEPTLGAADSHIDRFSFSAL
jgi:hypothetical protein